MRHALAAVAVASFFVVQATPHAHAGIFTKMLVAGAGGACAMSAKCSAKAVGAKDAFARKFGPGIAARCADSARCSDFLARHPGIERMAATRGMTVGPAGIPASGSLAETLQSR